MGNLPKSRDRTRRLMPRRPDAAGALGVEVDANECGAAVITKIVRNSQVSELLEVGAVVDVVSAQELATFVLTMARPEASVRALRDVLRKNQKNKDLGDGWSAAGPGMGSRFRK